MTSYHWSMMVSNIFVPGVKKKVFHWTPDSVKLSFFFVIIPAIAFQDLCEVWLYHQHKVSIRLRSSLHFCFCPDTWIPCAWIHLLYLLPQNLLLSLHLQSGIIRSTNTLSRDFRVTGCSDWRCWTYRVFIYFPFEEGQLSVHEWANQPLYILSNFNSTCLRNVLPWRIRFLIHLYLFWH